MSHVVEPLDDRVLILTPQEDEAQLIRSMLKTAGIPNAVCSDVAELRSLLGQGGAVLVVAQEALSAGATRHLASVLGQQPPWSEPPILLFVESADSSIVIEALERLANVTVLQRPIGYATLSSGVRSALRARQCQYQIRAHVLERERYAEALRAGDRRKDTFLATLAHELRNPLAPMRTALEIMRISREEPSRQQAQAVLERQLTQMTRLVDDLLNLSRVSHGKLELKREHVALNAVLENAVEIARPSIDARRHELEVTVPSEPMYLNADPTRLSQVFSNLLHNAARYTRRGGLIELSAERDRSHVHVHVRDNGIGIAPENLHRVFEMFTQVGRSIEQSRGGLGVGLSLSQWLVRLHSGTIRARSEGLGKGSEFIVRLPA